MNTIIFMLSLFLVYVYILLGVLTYRLAINCCLKPIVRGNNLWHRSGNTCLPSHNPRPSLCLQTEIAKRLGSIIGQVLPFLSQEVSCVHR